jgi:hypothetical protein
VLFRSILEEWKDADGPDYEHEREGRELQRLRLEALQWAKKFDKDIWAEWEPDIIYEALTHLHLQIVMWAVTEAKLPLTDLVPLSLSIWGTTAKP